MEKTNNPILSTTKTVKTLCNYKFSEGILIPQTIKKRDLAAFYGKSNKGFYKELHIADENVEIKCKTVHFFDKKDCEIIFKLLGNVYESDISTYQNTNLKKIQTSKKKKRRK